MLMLSSEEIRAAAPVTRVIDCLEQAFREGCVAPLRQVAEMPGGEGGRLFLSMPAFHREGGGVTKLATVFPDNPAQGLPTIQSVIVVFSETGAPVALLDGIAVTQLRTGAASALASRYLSREDSAHLVVMGTGALAPAMAEAHCAARPITRVSVWGRRPERAAATAEAIRARVSATEAMTDGTMSAARTAAGRGGAPGKPEVEVVAPAALEEAVSTADIISCSTSSVTPLLAGKWLKPGAFVDLVGSFSPRKREADDDVVRRSRLFVDTFEGALSEAGDFLDPLERGVITRERIEGELADLVSGRTVGRRTPDEIITFKSVGAAIEDLATSRLVVGALSR